MIKPTKMRSLLLPLLAAGGLALAGVGCMPSTPESPTWYADVQPMLRGNCIRCHDGIAFGSAPSTRFDLFADIQIFDPTVDAKDPDPYRRWYGAQSTAMNGNLTAYAVDPDASTPMPPKPYKRLSDRQQEILTNWAKNPQLGQRPAGNRPPEVKLRGAAANADGDIVIDYEATDPDHDGVWGTVKFGAGDNDIAAIIPQGGLGTVVWKTAGKITAGSHTLTAVVQDDEVASAPVSIDVTVP